MSLSYQHIYHAGNPADIQKHLWVLAVITYLQKKDKPLFWCDTHAGRGLYDLHLSEAQKTKEFKRGIERIYHHPIDHPLWIKLKSIITSFNPDKALQFYPGSALLAATQLRSNDRMECYDLHPQEFTFLSKAMKPYRNVTARQIKMEEGLLSCTPPKEKRGAVLIDPSYEIKSEYESIPKIVQKSLKKWPNATYMIWYPLLPQGRHELLKAECRALELDILIDEWIYDDPTQESFRGMYGTGMVVLNVPYSVPETVLSCKDILSPLLRSNESKFVS